MVQTCGSITILSYVGEKPTLVFGTGIPDKFWQIQIDGCSSPTGTSVVAIDTIIRYINIGYSLNDPNNLLGTSIQDYQQLPNSVPILTTPIIQISSVPSGTKIIQIAGVPIIQNLIPVWIYDDMFPSGHYNSGIPPSDVQGYIDRGYTLVDPNNIYRLQPSVSTPIINAPSTPTPSITSVNAPVSQGVKQNINKMIIPLVIIGGIGVVLVALAFRKKR